MSEEPHHVALPQLYGAPAYARPPKAVDHTARPFDPDDLPIAAAMTDEDAALLDVTRSASGAGDGAHPDQFPTPRRLSLRAVSERLRGARG